jgi:hypothetical protein
MPYTRRAVLASLLAEVVQIKLTEAKVSLLRYMLLQLPPDIRTVDADLDLICSTHNDSCAP